MSEPKLISPLLDRFYMGDPISEHDGVRCCPAMEKLSEDKYIVKVISLPATQVQLDALLLSGAYADKAEALAYFKSIAQGIEKEAKALKEISQLEGFVAYEGCQIVPKDDDAGYDVYLLSPYRRTLERYMHKHPITHLEALNLGLDMCAALAICRRSGYLYVDLKPENIAMLPDKEFRIADLGFIHLDSLKYASLPDRYRSKYTAPEIADPFASLNTTIDIYAAGLILYQIFNGGQLPALDENSQLPPPAYADYEISEIILKACSRSPEARWQDPVEMGQALVAYMQRNGAHDVPIVAPITPAETEETTTDSSAAEEVADEETVGLFEDTGDSDADEITEVPESDADEGGTQSEQEDIETPSQETEDAQDEAPTYAEDDDGVLSFLLPESDDETAPENAPEDVPDVEVTQEVSDMLDQADDLIAHQPPDPVVPPEPIDVPIPPALPTQDETDTEPADMEEPSGEAETENVENTGAEDASKEEAQDADDKTTKSDKVAEAEAEADSEPEEQPTEEDSQNASNDDAGAEEDVPTPKKPKHILRNVLLTILALLLIAAGVLFYKYYYLQTIDNLSVDDSDTGIITVNVTTEIPEEQLTVICIDTYGNQLSSPVLNGKARFSKLAPNTTYSVEVDIQGFHKLTGKTSASFTTPDVTKIVQFLALTGNEDGSVILNFTPDGTEPEHWIIRYKNDAGEEVENSFTGHMHTLTGLTVGNSYTFHLSVTDALRISGVTEVTHTASNVIKASNVQITGCYMNKLGVIWDAPENVEVTSWTVRCYNDNGFDETVTSETTEAAFDIPDDNAAYTVEVTAANMSVSERVDIPENSITVGVYNADTSAPSALKLSWTSSKEVPEGGWIVSYIIDGVSSHELTVESGNEVVISPLVPGSEYVVSLKTVAGNTVLGSSYSFKAADAGKYEGYAVTADDMEFMMCVRPSYSGWDRYDISRSSYRTEFSTDEEAGYVIRMRTKYNTDSSEITALFVIRDEFGKIASIDSTTSTWERMWYNGYCELDVPSLPDTPGNYTISVYFDGALAQENSITIVN